MRIIRTIESFYPYVSGPANQAYQISKRLKDSPILTTNLYAEKSPKKEIMDGVQVTRLSNKFNIMKYCYTPQLKKILRNVNCDVIHSHNYRNYQADIAFKIAKERGIPFVISVHGALLGYAKYLKGARTLPYKAYDFMTGKSTVLDAHRVIVSSEIEVNEALEFGVMQEKIIHIPMGIDVKKYECARKPKKNITALFVGRISRNRNLVPIIKAMGLVDNRIKLRIVGNETSSSGLQKSGYMDELRTLAAGNKRIEFVGARYGNDLISEYKNADIFVYTSLSENFGQTLLEAGACGLPIVTTDVGIASEIMESNSGFIIGHNDVGAISLAMNRLLNSSKRAAIGRDIQKTVKTKYSWDKIVESYNNLYSQICTELK